jgi:hypothetical protein
MFRTGTRRELQRRLTRLAPARAPLWGRMTAPRMVVHVADALRMALGDLPVAAKATPLCLPVIKQLAIYVLPFPKGVPTAPELLARVPAAWNSEMVTLSALIERFAERPVAGPWPRHPVFGTMSGRAWGVLAYRHCDHHLRQFGS